MGTSKVEDRNMIEAEAVEAPYLVVEDTKALVDRPTLGLHLTVNNMELIV